MKKQKETVKKSLVQLSTTLYADKDTYDKVHRHLTDINDTITEEDIENVSTDIVVKKIYEATKNDQSSFKKNDGNNNRLLGADLSESAEEKMYEQGKKINSVWNVVNE